MTLKRHSLATPAAVPPPVRPDLVTPLLAEIRKLDEEDLQELRYQVDKILGLDLEALDLADELALQFQQGKALQREVSSDNSVPANQRAQVLNSVRTSLAGIIKQQEVVWGMERLKKFEVAFTKVAAMMTVEQRHVFLDLYKQYLLDVTKNPLAIALMSEEAPQ